MTDDNNFDHELRELFSAELDRFIRDNDGGAKASEGKTPLDERIQRYAATLPPDQREDLLTGWPYFSRNASEAELENISRKLDRDFPEGATGEGRATKRLLRQLAKFKTLDPNEADKVLQSWRYLQLHYSEAELDRMFPRRSREERRERAQQALQRIYDLTDGESGDQSSDSA
jgi:hypothetical protein